MKYDKDNFKPTFKRLMRQLNERAVKVYNRQKPASYFENKRLEFVEFIDECMSQGCFIMPKEGTRIWRIYNNKS